VDHKETGFEDVHQFQLSQWQTLMNMVMNFQVP